MYFDKQQIKKEWISYMGKNISMDDIDLNLPLNIGQYNFMGVKYGGKYKLSSLGCLAWVLDQHELATFAWKDWNTTAFENEKVDGLKILAAFSDKDANPMGVGYNFTQMRIPHLNIYNSNMTIQKMLDSEYFMNKTLNLK